MTVTMHEGREKDIVILTAKDERFIKKWGRTIDISLELLYSELKLMSYWANNVLGEELLIEID